jgi:D-alanyl-D-alanine dipeptidase
MHLRTKLLQIRKFSFLLRRFSSLKYYGLMKFKVHRSRFAGRGSFDQSSLERVMSTRLFWAIAIAVSIAAGSAAQAEIPDGFVYLSEVAPTIRQDIRYAGSHNFIGRPVDGYRANECIVIDRTAEALARVQNELAARNLSLIVWDCYRPTRAVRDFIGWSQTPQAAMKTEFYPNTEKSQFFRLGYLASHSMHSRGSTVDLGVVPDTYRAPPPFDPSVPLVPCTAPKGKRFEDGTIDLGTGYDCLDPMASTNHPGVSREAHDNRMLLQRVMQQQGFKPYSKEWWHFEFAGDPSATQALDFPIVPRSGQPRPPRPPAVSTIWTPFKNAVREGNGAAIAKMAVFPLPTARGELDRDAFTAEFDQIFDGRLTACVAWGSPEPMPKSPESDFAVRCKNNRYDYALQFHRQPDGNWYLVKTVGSDSSSQELRRGDARRGD